MKKYDRDPEPSLEPPEPGPWPICPVCGEETDTYIKRADGEIVGCPECLSRWNAWEEMDG